MLARHSSSSSCSSPHSGRKSQAGGAAIAGAFADASLSGGTGEGEAQPGPDGAGHFANGGYIVRAAGTTVHGVVKTKRRGRFLSATALGFFL